MGDSNVTELHAKSIPPVMGRLLNHTTNIYQYYLKTLTELQNLNTLGEQHSKDRTEISKLIPTL